MSKLEFSNKKLHFLQKVRWIMINNVSVIEHDKLILYSLDDFAMDEDLQECMAFCQVLSNLPI